MADASVVDLEAADLDGDGVEELIVARGGADAYDLVVLGPNGEVRARRRMGDISAIATLPPGIIAAFRTTAHPGHSSFPAHAPIGDEVGMHLLAFDGTDLQPLGVVALPAALQTRSSLRIDSIQAIDLDNDGRLDLAAAVRSDRSHASHTWILRATSDASFESLVIPGLRLLAAANVDGDTSAELIVADSMANEQVWVLGAGDDAAPSLLAANPRPDGNGPEGDPALEQAWARAVDLDAMGLSSHAGSAFRDVAVQSSGMPWEAEAWRRAGTLLAEAGDETGATTAWSALGEIEGHRAVARAGTLRGLLHRQRWADARRLIDAAGGLSALPEADRDALEPAISDIRGLARGASAVDMRFDQPLRRTWQIDDAVRFRRDPHARELVIEAMGGRDGAMSTPVLWSGAAAELVVDMNITRMDPGATIAIGLAAEGSAEPVIGFSIFGDGAPGRLARVAECGSNTGLAAVHAVASADTPTRVEAVISWMPASGKLACRIEVAGQRVVHGEHPVELPDATGWRLVVAQTGTDAGVSHAAARITTLRVDGADLEIAKVAGHEGMLMLAEGRDFAALRELDDGVARVVALDRAGDRDAASAEVKRLAARHDLARHSRDGTLAGAPVALALADLYRLDKSPLAPLLDGALAPDVAARLHLRNAESRSRYTNGTNPDGLRSADRALGLLDRTENPTPDELALRARVQLHRGRVFIGLDAAEAATIALTEAASLSAGLDKALAHVELAGIKADAGDEHGALAHASAAAEAAPDSFLVVDKLVAHTVISRWVDRRDWREVLGPFARAFPDR
jgi:hypothetical protein